MTSVKDWYLLGSYHYGLGVPVSMRDEIRASTDYKTEEEKKAAFLQYFLDNVPMASWQTVAGALHMREEKKALQMVQPFLPPSGESACVTVGKAVADCGVMTFDPQKEGKAMRPL